MAVAVTLLSLLTHIRQIYYVKCIDLFTETAFTKEKLKIKIGNNSWIRRIHHKLNNVEKHFFYIFYELF